MNISLLQKINNYIGIKFGKPNPVISETENLRIVDGRFEKYKVFICVCSSKVPCHCRSIIPLKKWRGNIRVWMFSKRKKIT